MGIEAIDDDWLKIGKLVKKYIFWSSTILGLGFSGQVENEKLLQLCRFTKARKHLSWPSCLSSGKELSWVSHEGKPSIASYDWLS